MARYLIGIDLGTTNSALAYIDLQRPARSNRVEIKPFPVSQLAAPAEVKERTLLPSFLYLPGEHDLPAGATALPWDPHRSFAVGEFARNHGEPLLMKCCQKLMASDPEERRRNGGTAPRLHCTQLRAEPWPRPAPGRAATGPTAGIFGARRGFNLIGARVAATICSMREDAFGPKSMPSPLFGSRFFIPLGAEVFGGKRAPSRR